MATTTYDWQNQNTISNDLLVVAKGRVKVSEFTIDKPAPLIMTEETEEAFFLCEGDNGSDEDSSSSSRPPDLQSIQAMLLMLKAEEAGLNGPETIQQPQQVTLSKLNINAPLFTPKEQKKTALALQSQAEIQNSDDRVLSNDQVKGLSAIMKQRIGVDTTERNVTRKRQRNVAIASLIKIMAGVAPTGFNANDELTDHETNEIAIEDDSKESSQNFKTTVKDTSIVKDVIKSKKEAKITSLMTPTSMFRKKTKSIKVDSPAPLPLVLPSVTKANTHEIEYEPSEEYDKLYKKYLERREQPQEKEEIEQVGESMLWNVILRSLNNKKINEQGREGDSRSDDFPAQRASSKI